jgi:hypothetical protein
LSARPVRRGDRALGRNTFLAGASLCCLAVISAGVALSSRGSAVDADADNSASHAAAFRLALIDPATPPVVKRDPRAPLATPGPYLAAHAKPPVQFAAALHVLPPHRPAHLARAEVAKPAVAETQLAALEPATADAVPDALVANEIVAKNDAASDGIVKEHATREAIAKAEAEAANVVKEFGRPETVAAAQPQSQSQPQAPVAHPARASVYFASAPLADSMTTGSLGTLLQEPADGGNDEAAAVSPAPPQAPLLAPALAYAAPEPHRARSAEKLALAPMLPPHKPDKPKHKLGAQKLTAYEKLYGGPVRLASLAPFNITREDTDELPRAPYDRRTAVYVITEKKVYLPDGTVLEAHSGLGDKMDNPRYANVRMRGVTPPHVYRLKMREALFHGVEAIRMLPLGGSEAIHGRDGILAHTYMLGPSGQSNGCVSFKDYDTFLEAFKDGKFDRIAVIASID